MKVSAMKYALAVGLFVLVLGAGWSAYKYWDIYWACADIKKMADNTVYSSVMDGAVIKSADDFMLRQCDEALGPFF